MEAILVGNRKAISCQPCAIQRTKYLFLFSVTFQGSFHPKVPLDHVKYIRIITQTERLMVLKAIVQNSYKAKIKHYKGFKKAFKPTASVRAFS